MEGRRIQDNAGSKHPTYRVDEPWPRRHGDIPGFKKPLGRHKAEGFSRPLLQGGVRAHSGKCLPPGEIIGFPNIRSLSTEDSNSYP